MSDPKPRGLLTPLAVLAAALALLAYYVSGSSTPAPATSSSSLTPRDASQTPLSSTQTNSSSRSLSFGPLRFAGHANWIFRDDVTAAQVVISEYVYVGEALDVTLKNVSSVSHEDGQRGITGDLSLSDDATLGQTILGSVRTLREVVEDGRSTNLTTRLGGYDSDSVWLTRTWLDGTAQYLGLFAGKNTRLDVRPADSPNGPPSVNISRIDPSKNATIKFESTFNFTASLRGLGMDDLFASEGDTEVIAAIRAAPDVVDQLAFLAYESEFLAGGWRFLTYFGRDTLLAMQVLLPVLSPTACEGILAGVIQRTGPDGQLCHEETIGDYASILNIEAGHPERGAAPVYDYKMVDTDFLLLPALAAYAKRYPARVRALMARNSTLVPGTFGELVQRNVDRVLRLARPFAESPAKERLISLKAWPFGNWRDSASGNGWGHYPFDVNCAMVPAALRAISDLTGSLLPTSTYVDAHIWARTWEEKGCALFALPISAAEAESRLATYVRAANLTSDLLFGAGSLNASQTASGWNDPAHVVGAGAPLYGLALSDSGSPVAVQHSDLAFALLYSPTIPEGLIRATVEALQPYPRGLLTNVGMVVANAAYDTNTASAATFGNTAYHGAVAWSWQQAWMAAGVGRQLKLCDPSASTSATPRWCDELAPALKDAQLRLWDSIAGSESVLWTEVWSPILHDGKFSIGDLGAISADGSEGDAVQLWSYAFLALRDARTGRPAVAGFE